MTPVRHYGANVPPCFDVYIWVEPDERASTLSRFVADYVDSANPGEPRFDAFLRTYVTAAPMPGDSDALAELCRDPDAVSAFSLYLRARDFYGAIVTLTEEGAVVLGLSIDDPLDEPDVEPRASDLIASMMEEFNGKAGVGGVELAPPQSAEEWADDGLITMRMGSI